MPCRQVQEEKRKKGEKGKAKRIAEEWKRNNYI
jgi:hypothetical protein